MKQALAATFGALLATVSSAQMPGLSDIMKGAGNLPKASNPARARATTRQREPESRRRLRSVPKTR